MKPLTRHRRAFARRMQGDFKLEGEAVETESRKQKAERGTVQGGAPAFVETCPGIGGTWTVGVPGEVDFPKS